MNTTPHSPGGSPRSERDNASPATPPARGSLSVRKNGTSRRESSSRRSPGRSPRTGKLVALSVIIIAVWMGIAAFGGPQFGNLSNVATNDQSSFLPQSSESAQSRRRSRSSGIKIGSPRSLLLSSLTGSPWIFPRWGRLLNNFVMLREGTTPRALSFHPTTKQLLKWLFCFHPTATRRMRWKTSHRR